MKTLVMSLLSLILLCMPKNEVLAAEIPTWFDPGFYAATYNDVVEVLGNEPEELYRHYRMYGKDEGRLPNPTSAAAEKPQQAILAYRIEVSKTDNICSVYGVSEAGGEALIRSMVCSTGKPGHETPSGEFTIYEHTTGNAFHPMKGGVYAKYCMRFKEGGYMFHTICYKSKSSTEPMASHIKNLGKSVSSGCIRLAVEDAEWLFNTVPDGTPVKIY